MNFDLTDEQKMLREQALRFLRDAVSYDRLRALISDGHEFDEPLWRQVSELGWLAVSVPEKFEGLGLGALEQCVIAEELGRHVAAIPFMSSIGLAAEAVLRFGSDAQKSELLPQLASGTIVGAFAHAEGPGEPDAGSLTASVERNRLTGTKWPVLDGTHADIFVVTAQGPDGSLGLFVARSGRSGVIRSRIDGFDQLRPGARVDFEDADCEQLGGGDARNAVQSLIDHAAVLTAFEQVGGAQSCLDMAQAYALERKAFGRAIGSFQAIKHKLADMLTKIELARSNAYYAGWAVANDAADKALAAATARVSATEAYEFAARENMQVHGGISFTWEANTHFHYRRSRLLAVSLGSSSYWNKRIVAQLSAAPVAAMSGRG